MLRLTFFLCVAAVFIFFVFPVVLYYIVSGKPHP